MLFCYMMMRKDLQRKCKAFLDPEQHDSPVYELIEHIILPEFGEVIATPNRNLETALGMTSNHLEAQLQMEHYTRSTQKWELLRVCLVVWQLFLITLMQTQIHDRVNQLTK